MNVRKHMAGLAIFSFILGSAIFINHYLTIPDITIPHMPLRPPIAEAVESPDISYKVRLVSLEFTNMTTGYTSLSVKLRPGHPAPEKLWVTTFYFSTDIDHSGWSSTTEIRQPFAKSNEVELVASDSFAGGSPKVGYFARVYVSTGYTDNSYPQDIRFNRNIKDAIPVVVQWPDK